MTRYRVAGIGVLLVLPLMIGCGDADSPRTNEVPETTTSDSSPTATQQSETPAAPNIGRPRSIRVVTDPDFEPEEGFTRLTLEDFTPFQGDHTWGEYDGVIICHPDEPKGYLYSNDTFSNFTWRAEYQCMPSDADAMPPPNTGFMIHIQEPHTIWPRSLEVQGRWDEMCSIKPNGGVPDLVINDDPAMRESARKPVGEWNAVEIVSRDGALTATLNGELICTSEPGELTEGRIGLQSELFEVRFRRLRIRRDE